MNLSKLIGALTLSLAILVLFTSRPRAAAIDTTSGASIHVTTGSKTTATTAIFRWVENKPNGHLCLFWDTASIPWNTMHDSTCWTYLAIQVNGAWQITFRPTVDTIRNLSPATTYHYAIQGFYPIDHTGMGPSVPVYSARGTFATDPSTGLLRVDRPVPGAEKSWSPEGKPSPAGHWRIGPTGAVWVP